LSEDLDIKEEFFAQPYYFKPREASKLTILLHPTSYFIYHIRGYSFGGSQLAQIVCQKLVILVYNVLNMDIFASEGLY